MERLVEAVQAVIAVDTLNRIPDVYRGVVTFFSYSDLWAYVAIYDERACDKCMQYATGSLYYHGDSLRTYFPDLVVVDEDTIEAHVHPNCRCILTRLIIVEEEE